MALMPAPPERSLASFDGDPDALVADFFCVWSRDLPEALAAVNGRICDQVLGIGQTRFASWFKLPASQADALICAGYGKEDSQWAAGWRLTIEELCGFTFQCSSSSVPESAALVRHTNVLQPRCAQTSEPMRPLTVGGRLMASGQFLDQRLPCGLLDVVVTPNPKLNAITQPETEAVTDALCEYIAAAHGSWKIGKPLAKHYGKQVEKVLPLLPDYGKVTGAHRKWESMIYEKCRNRFYVPAPF